MKNAVDRTRRRAGTDPVEDAAADAPEARHPPAGAARRATTAARRRTASASAQMQAQMPFRPQDAESMRVYSALMDRPAKFITDRYNELRQSEKKVAESVLGNPEEVIHFSVSQLAEQARVSDPTVIRFCRALGFKGFQDFKIHLAQNIIPAVRSIHESANEKEEAPELVRKVFDANREAITRTFGTLDFAIVQKCIDEICAADKIIFHGLAGSAAVAMDAHHKFFRIGIPCEWFGDTHMAIMAAAMMKRGQVFIAISHSGATHDVIEAVQVAKSAGASTVGIVSYAKSPLSKIVKHTLLVGSSETGFRFEPMASRIAQLCVIDVLSVGVAMRRSDEVISNLTKSRNAIAKRRY